MTETGLRINTTNDGRFEIPRVLPGTYTLEVQALDYYGLNQTLAVGDEDVYLTLPLRPAL
jgi:hypothetical protein